MEFIISVIFILMVFVFGVFIFQQRTDLNLLSFQKWEAQEKAYRLARNINNTFLLDDNSSITDTIFWSGGNRSVSLGVRSVQFWAGDVFTDASLVSTNIKWNISDLNGNIYFRKIDGNVVVSYS